MDSVILQLLFGLGCISVGFFFGLSLSWREYRIGGRDIAAPSLPNTDVKQTLWLLAVATLAAASAAYAGVQATDQNNCNADFKRSIITRSAITTESQQHLDSMIATIAEASAHPEPDSRERVRAALADYQQWSAEAAARRAAHPIADPVCGS